MERAQYYSPGYLPPSGVSSATAVKEYQRMLGVSADGIWGPKTQAAYDQYLAGQQAAATPNKWGNGSGGADTDLFGSYYEAILRQLDVPSLSVDIPSQEAVKDQWQSALRPSLDAAVSRRQSASQATRAELDADAVSRGMGSSSYVTSIKERESADAQADIGEMEAQYGATLAERIAATLQSYDQLRLSAQQYNLQAQQAARQSALNLAGNWYGDYMTQQNALAQAAAKSAGSGSKSGSTGAKASSRLTANDYLGYVDNLPDSQRQELFTSSQAYWKVRRDELQDALGSEAYLALRKSYTGK